MPVNCMRVCCVMSILIVVAAASGTGIYFAVTRRGDGDDPTERDEPETEESGKSTAKNFGERNDPVVINDIFFGLSYSPFGLGDNVLCPPFDDIGGMCILSDQVRADMRQIAGLTKRVKTYSLNCFSQTVSLIRFAEENSMSIMLGVWTDRVPSKNDEELERFKAVLDEFKGSDVITHVLVGNEPLFVQGASEKELLRHIENVKDVMKDMGVSIPVGTAEIYAVWTGKKTEDTPGSGKLQSDRPLDAVVEASDWIGLNVHPYYAGVDPRDGKAGKHVFDEARALEKFFAGRDLAKPVIVAETGYPTKGDARKTGLGTATPGVEGLSLFAQQIESISRSEDLDVYFFEPYNGDWKRRWLPYTELDYSFGLHTCDRELKDGLTLPSPRS